MYECCHAVFVYPEAGRNTRWPTRGQFAGNSATASILIVYAVPVKDITT